MYSPPHIILVYWYYYKSNVLCESQSALKLKTDSVELRLVKLEQTLCERERDKNQQQAARCLFVLGGHSRLNENSNWVSLETCKLSAVFCVQLEAF